MSNSSSENIRARDAWDMNARFWDERMADGNDFFISLIWPSVEKLLSPQPGEKLLDIACGNGLTSRRLAHAGAAVVAFDFSEEMIRWSPLQHGLDGRGGYSAAYERRGFIATTRRALRVFLTPSVLQ